MNTAAITRVAGKATGKIKKNAPRILFVAGMVGSVSTVVLAARAGSKTTPIMDHLADQREQLDEIERNASEILKPGDYEKAVKEQYANTGVELAKLYAPVVVVGVVSVVCLTKSHQILSNRNAALTVAVGALDRAMKDYRGRVRAELGDAKDQEFLHGTVDEEIETVNSKGVTKTKTVAKLDPDGATPYSYHFDETNQSWDKDPGYNQTYLENQQKWANIQLRKNGHLFLNEVFDLLRIPHTPMGQIAGWIYHPEDTEGDGYVDFGFNKDGEFLAGYKPSVWLDFNVDGPILDKI